MTNFIKVTPVTYSILLCIYILYESISACSAPHCLHPRVGSLSECRTCYKLLNLLYHTMSCSYIFQPTVEPKLQVCVYLIQVMLGVQWMKPAACWEAPRGISVDVKPPPTTQGSSTLLSEWPTSSSISTRWRLPRAMALNRNMRWEDATKLLPYTLTAWDNTESSSGIQTDP